MATQSPWNNYDGLTVKFGAEEAKSLHGAGEVAGHVGNELLLEVEINLDELSTTDAVMGYSAWLPHDALVTHVRVVPLVTATGSSAILDVGHGYFATAGSTALTLIAADSLIAAHAVASMAVGEVADFALTTDSSINNAYLDSVVTGGSDIGTEIASTKNRYYITASESDSNAFTAGVVKVEVYYIPQGVQKVNTPS